MTKLRAVSITERSAPGMFVSRVVMVDDSIPVDVYVPSEPLARWYCDHCDAGVPVSAQFKVTRKTWITLCADCLQHALNGIAVSMANPVLREVRRTA
jgi:hypothetical protein